MQCPVSPPQQTVQVAAAGGGKADTEQLTRGEAEEWSTRPAAEERSSCGGWASCSTAARDNSNTPPTRCCHLHSERHPVPRPPAPAAVEPVLARLLDRVLTHRTKEALADVFLDSGPVSRNFPCTES